MMKPMRFLLLVVLGGCVIAATSAPAEEPSNPKRGSSKADHPRRKVVVGTVIYGPYGDYHGFGERIKVLSGFVDAMAAVAIKDYPGHGLDLAVLPETTVTSTRRPAAQRAIPLQGQVLDSLSNLARRHGTYLYEPREDLGMFWSNDPAISIGSMLGSLGLEEIDAQIARNRRLQDAARGHSTP
jgi:hypothetical protein